MAPLVVMLSGCAGSVIFGHTIGGAPVTTQPSETPFRAVSVTFTPQADEEINADPRFDREVLTAAVTSELRAHQLLADSDTPPGNPAAADHTLEVVVGEFTVKPASNAAFLGYVLNNGTLKGSIAVHDAAGHELRRFDIKAESGLASPADGKQAQPLVPLYRKFADLTVGRLAGEPEKAPTPEMPR